MEQQYNNKFVIFHFVTLRIAYVHFAAFFNKNYIKTKKFTLFIIIFLNKKKTKKNKPRNLIARQRTCHRTKMYQTKIKRDQKQKKLKLN